MKTRNIILIGLFATALFTTLITGCKKDKKEEPLPQENIIPERFYVEIPDAINSATNPQNKKEDEIQGGDVYKHIRNFIHIGDEAAKTMRDLLIAFRKLNIYGVKTVTFKANEDGRMKKIEITEKQNYEGTTWQYKMIVTDESSKENAIHFYWNIKSIKGIAFLHFYNINQNIEKRFTNTMYKIEYNEDAKGNYQKEMTVSLTNLPEEKSDGTFDKNYVKSLKMFVGKKDNMVEIYGNSHHPTVRFIDTANVWAGGRNYAFVARCNDALNIAVAEVGLPPLTAEETGNELLKKYSVYKIFSDEIHSIGIKDQTVIDSFLKNTKPPGYFMGGKGFVSSGDSIPSTNKTEYLELKDLSKLSPFKPKDVAELVIKF